MIWLNTQHAWYSTDHTPPCWPEHPPLVRELGALAVLRYQAGEATSPLPLEEWHAMPCLATLTAPATNAEPATRNTNPGPDGQPTPATRMGQHGVVSWCPRRC